MQTAVFEKEYEVRSYDTDPQARLGTGTLFSYLQDIAGLHAEKLHFGRNDLKTEKQFWVLSRMICRLTGMPAWDDVLKITTWPKGVEGVFAIRNFRISDIKNNLIGEASSSWIIVDMDTRRPLRPGTNLMEFKDNSPFAGFNCPVAARIPLEEDKPYRSPLKEVRYSDLDINMHVNNARYLNWITDSYPMEFLRKNVPAEIEVNYLSETTTGDDYYVTTEEKSNIFYHSVVKENGARVACRARISWNPCDENKLY